MGRLDDPAYIGAIAIGGIIFNIIYWGFGFLRPGTTGLTAQAFGQDDKKECFNLLYRSSIIGFSLGVIILLMHEPIGHLAFSVLSGSAQVESLASEYFKIRIFAAPAVISVFALRGWFFGMQDAITPMILTISANVLNILISWHLVINLDMSVKGVALGTLIAQWITFFIAICILLYKHRISVFKYLNRAIFMAKEMRRFLTVNRDMFIRNMGLILVFSFFTNHSSTINDSYLAVTQILLQLFYFMSYAVDGFAYASESLVGKYMGQKKSAKLRQVIAKCLIFGLSFGTLFSISYVLFGHSILRLFTTNENLLTEATPYFIWLALVAISGALAFIWDGIFSGATASTALRDSMLVSVVFFFLTFYGLNPTFPLISIWAGMVVFMLSRSFCQIIIYQTKLKKQWLLD